MAGQQTQQWGLTPPISTALPTEQELALNDALIAELKAQDNFEAPHETEKRAVVLRSLQKITVEFVKHVSKLQGLSQTVISEGGGKIFTYGSYRLGVFGPGSDIDTLVVVPKHVTRQDFFDHFPDLLQQMAPPGAIEELKVVRDAFVPIINFEYSSIKIDLIFARLHVSSVPINLTLKNNSLLRGLDETDLRCVNGTRVTDEMLELVPQVKTFRNALRAIKLWAQRRAVYSNVMGFPGGVAWAMMVARICQLYPQATASVVVGRFFHLMAPWPWPRPVLLKNIEDGPLQVRVWNPAIYPGDRGHLMPIITPAYPSMCATHNVNKSSMTVITRELNRASEITNNIAAGRLRWKDLFERHSFFTNGYKYYLGVIAASKTKEAQLIWSGLVESRVRRLVLAIEKSDAASVALTHPFTKGFERVHRCASDEEKDMILQGSLQFQISKTETTDESREPEQVAAAEGGAEGIEPKAEADAAQNGENSNTGEQAMNGEHSKNGEEATNGEEAKDKEEPYNVYTTTYYLGIELNKDVKHLDILEPVDEFKKQCKQWQGYSEDLNSLRVVHTRNYDLPDDVFEPGEQRPVRARRPKAAKEGLAAKRSFSATEMAGDGAAAAKRHASATVAS